MDKYSAILHRCLSIYIRVALKGADTHYRPLALVTLEIVTTLNSLQTSSGNKHGEEENNYHPL